MPFPVVDGVWFILSCAALGNLIVPTYNGIEKYVRISVLYIFSPFPVSLQLNIPFAKHSKFIYRVMTS